MSELKIEISSFFENLEIALSKSVDRLSTHDEMHPDFPSEITSKFTDEKDFSLAAVIILLFWENNCLKTIFIERTQSPGHHSGQIAFPGGKYEKSDRNLQFTAIRECLEEIGVNVNPNNIIGNLTPVSIPISKFSVMPVVAKSDVICEFIPCEEEVKNIFIVDLIELLKTKTFRTIIVGEHEILTPCYIFEDKIVWGATAKVLNELHEIFKELTIC